MLEEKSNVRNFLTEKSALAKEGFQRLQRISVPSFGSSGTGNRLIKLVQYALTNEIGILSCHVVDPL